MARKRTNYFVKSNGKIEHRFFYNGIKYSVYGSSYDECNEKKEEKLERLKAGLLSRAATITLNEYYAEWQQGREGTIKRSTRYANDVKYKRVGKMIGRMKVANIGPRDVKAVQRDLAKELSTSTVNDALTLLSSIMQGAIEDRLIKNNPCGAVHVLKKKTDEKAAAETIHRALTQEEQTIFFQYAKGSWYYYLFAFMILTGVRIGEAGALTWRDIDTDKNVIHITKTISRVSNTEYIIDSTKTEAGKRDIPLTDPIQRILSDLRDVSRILQYDGRIFTGSNGEMLKKNNVNTCIDHILATIEKKTGRKIDHFSSHAFRDTFATRAVEQGMQPKTLQKILGHSDISITMNLYVHCMEETKAAEMQMLNIAIG